MNVYYATSAFFLFFAVSGQAHSASSMQFRAAVIISNVSHEYDGSPKSVAVQTIPPGLSVKVTYNGNNQPPVDAGVYEVYAEIDHRFWEGSATAEMEITPAPAVISFQNTVQQYNGEQKSVTVTTVPPGLKVKTSYDPDPPINAGSYKVEAAIDDKNYVGQTSATLIIEKVAVEISLENLTRQFDGSPKPVTARTNPPNVPLEIFYSGSSDPPSAAGQYEVTAIPKDQVNYSGAGKGVLTINTQPEVVSSPVIEVEEGQESYAFDLGQAFHDPDSWDNLSFAITGNSNESMFSSIHIAGSILEMTFSTDAEGAAVLIIEAADRYGASAHTNVVVSLSPINDPPILEIDSETIVFVPVRDEPVQLFEWVKITDPDSETMTGAQILFAPRAYDKNADALLCEDFGNIRCSFSRDAGILNLTGEDTKENYEQALKKIRYNNRSEKEFTENRILTIYVDDGEASSNFVRKEIRIDQSFVELSIPTAFTPNSDVINDTWKIKNLDRYPDAVVSVYNRFGQLIFRSSSTEREWNGQYGGKQAPAGSYLYQIRIESYDKTYTGYVSLIR